MKSTSHKLRGGHARPSPSPPPATKFGVAEGFTLAFGGFLGLAILKFGNPVILDANVSAPQSISEAWSEAWPPHWGLWLMLALALAGVSLTVIEAPRWPVSRWLWILPVSWFGWQLVSATHSVDLALTALTLFQFTGCVAAYFLGVWLFGSRGRLPWLLAGLLLAFAGCLVQAANQKLFEFPQERELLMEGERMGWTNFTPEAVQDMKNTAMIITSNGVDIANPLLMAKFAKGRVHGTMVYPNALAGIVLLLLPVAMALAIHQTHRFRRATRYAAIVLALYLGFGSLFWTGSKSGWLIAVTLVAIGLFRLRWPRRWKWATLALVITLGIAAFAIRFEHYFAAGATSVGARFDYWRAAVEVARDSPVFGTGPGTFQRPYARLKAPESEMARLVHNDYLEQFSDSGILGGVSYAAWVALLLGTLWLRVQKSEEVLHFALFLGLLGFFAQGLSEFGLYVPALAWTAFALGGALLRRTAQSVSAAA